jgi:hypothetical protein
MSRRGLPQSFANVRSYYFRELVAEAERGGRPLDAFTLESFRFLWSRATSQAVDACFAALNRYDPETQSWDRPFRRIQR